MAEQVLAAVRTGPGTTEMREFPMPEIGDDEALLRIEVAGICGTDVKLYRKPTIDAPVIMGHENVGIVEKADSLLAPFDRTCKRPLLRPQSRKVSPRPRTKRCDSKAVLWFRYRARPNCPPPGRPE